jgi:hypothetical protein
MQDVDLKTLVEVLIGVVAFLGFFCLIALQSIDNRIARIQKDYFPKQPSYPEYPPNL